MLHLESKEYDLNMLLSFDFELLKEILLKLAKSQDKLENEIKKINAANIKRDNTLLKLEQYVFNSSQYSTDNLNNFNIKSNENENDINEINNYKETENTEKNNNINENNININKNNYDENQVKNEKEKENEQDKTNQNYSQNQKISQKNVLIEKKAVEKNNNKTNVNTNKNTDISQLKQLSPRNVQEHSSSGGTFVSPELFAKMMKQLKELISKVSILDNKMSSESKNIKNLENQLKNHILDNESEIKLINERIESLLQNNEEFEQKLENLQVKASELDVFSMFKDSGDGTIDATKILVKALEEKVFKKFELVDARYKKDSLENLKIKTNMDNITPKLDQFNRELDRINNNNKQQKEDLDNYKKANEEQKLENINNINSDFNTKISELKEEFEQKLKKNILLLENQLKMINNNNNDANTFDLIKLGLGNNGLDSEAAQALEKKINDLRKKTNDLENTIKLNNKREETDNIKKEIKDIKLSLDKKISKEDLKELYNFHLSDVDEINDIKDREGITSEELRKIIKDLQNVQQRVESLSGNLALLQNTPSNTNT